MAKIYRTKDVIKLEIGGLIFGISPLSFEQKMNVQSEILKPGTLSPMRGAALAVKYSLKSVEGLELEDGSPYQLELVDGVLSDGCWDDLQNMDQGQSLTMACLNLLDKVPKEFVNPQTGEKLEGVKLIKEPSTEKK